MVGGGEHGADPDGRAVGDESSERRQQVRAVEGRQLVAQRGDAVDRHHDLGSFPGRIVDAGVEVTVEAEQETAEALTVGRAHDRADLCPALQALQAVVAAAVDRVHVGACRGGRRAQRVDQREQRRRRAAAQRPAEREVAGGAIPPQWCDRLPVGLVDEPDDVAAQRCPGALASPVLVLWIVLVPGSVLVR